MSAKYVRDIIRSWTASVTNINYYDLINVEDNPSDLYWYTLEFFAQDNNNGTFCDTGYTENGFIDVVFFGPAGAGDSGLLTELETAMPLLLANKDPLGKFTIEDYEPTRELTEGTADGTYRLVVSLRYTYNA